MIIPSVIFSQTINIQRTASPPSVDGTISAGEYSSAENSNSFIQLEPFKGNSSSVLTKIYSAYDEKFIYFGIICYDPEPDKIVASIQSRDKLSDSDDALFIILDTFNDQRSAFVFGINPLGTQTDLRIRENGRNIDEKWDAQWLSAASTTDSGWVAEFAIPFESVSYNKNINYWGINFRRIFRRNFETSYWAGPLTYDYQISQQGKLQGIELPKKISTFVFTPYTTFRLENTEETENENKFNAEVGGDLTINMTSSLMANLTYNPDFATVEGDQERINLSRYELSYPEKRLFFMEGNELYSTRIRTFYSRRIGDIDYGAKVTGKISDYSISSLFTRSPRIDTNIVDYFSTVRVQKDIFKSSSVGFTFA
ncbi:MAG: carbohydrate binding family 9 domain-containing protein, partial [Cyclobacteriaceae bacterium]|nr:carbohydrate binding family 9 domain-containing protein [Cyclobacteriaceae bacterium]